MTRILVVDDEPSIVRVIGKRLEVEGYTVLVARDGLDGLNLARQEQPDLMILDLMLPKLNGWEVCRMLKFDERFVATRIILLTARAQSQDERLGLQCGADAYLRKPFQTEELLAQMRTLLAAPRAAQAGRAESAPPRPDVMRILVVDDEADIRKTLGKRLESWGYEALLAENGEIGVWLTRQRRPDLVLLDVMMPTMKGRDVCAALKADPATQAIPIILLTALGLPDHIRGGLEAGADDYLVKPFDAEELHRRIELCVRRHASSRVVSTQSLPPSVS